MRILLTNDDGYDAPGIKALYDALAGRHEIIVAAPQTEQSGIGHAFSYKSPLASHPIPPSMKMNGYAISGTPADCVKFAVAHLLDVMPDVVVSGMNNGENTGISGHYSGTVAAAREGALWGLRSIAFSLCEESADYLDDYCRVAATLLEKSATLAEHAFGTPQRRVFLNINFPACDPHACNGVRITYQSHAFFDDRYDELRSDDGSVQYLLRGTKCRIEDSDEYDSRAMQNRFVTITPLDCDSTATRAMAHLQSLNTTGPLRSEYE
jgi:5'-nucleotidase